jgi:cell division protein FtsQ
MPNKNGKTNSKPKKQKEQKTKNKNKIKTIFFLVLVIFIAICIYLLTSATYNIKSIEIEGNKVLTDEEVINLSNIKTGQNIFTTLEVVTKVKMKENGYIEDVKIKKKYPDKIKIQVKERQKAYQVLTETGCYIYIDEQGYILDYSLDKLDLKVITGMSISESQVKEIKRLEKKDLDKMERILHIREQAQKIGIEQDVEQIDVNDEYIIHLKDDKIIINIGDATDLSERMFFVKAILKEENNNSGTIYVNGNINEGFAPYFSAK